jgi:hypothetical protein
VPGKPSNALQIKGIVCLFDSSECHQHLAALQIFVDFNLKVSYQPQKEQCHPAILSCSQEAPDQIMQEGL